MAALKHLAKMPMGYFDTNPSGKLRKIIDENSFQTETFIAHQLPDLVGAQVTMVITRLCECGFLIRDNDKYIHLTEKGKEIAEMIYERHRFFTERLIEAGVDPKTAEKDACRLEHAISNESFQKLKGSLKK